MNKLTKAAGILGAWVLALSMMLVYATPALADHSDGHRKGQATSAANSDKGSSSQGSGTKSGSDHDGDADSDSNTSYTEDNDTNDGGTRNNVKDDGDNAHPSGKDRSVESGGSGNQGKSESDPDDDGRGPDRSNGGPDKPNGSGGVDKADQDGNNGCGNDDDFEDDNEGLCKGRQGPKVRAVNPPTKPNDDVRPSQPTKPNDDVRPSQPTKPNDDVKGEVIVRPSLPEVEVRPVGPGRPAEAEVLGVRIDRAAPARAQAAPAAPLPFTGTDLLPVAAVALALIAMGTMLARKARAR